MLVEMYISCAKCGTGLKIEQENGYVVKIEPCKSCLLQARCDGKIEGIEEQYESMRAHARGIEELLA